MRKYQLFKTLPEWTAKNTEIETHFGMPLETAKRYADVEQVTNEDHVKFGYFIMPAVGSGTWACQELFDASKLENYDVRWQNPDVPL
tara:strand:- start:39 stop:299 length:261 start_codon:yes stop_codon:yes gene_type:complete